VKTLHHPALRTSLRAPLHRLVRQVADRKRREPAWEELTPAEQQATGRLRRPAAPRRAVTDP
jgi:hypothetical protein